MYPAGSFVHVVIQMCIKTQWIVSWMVYNLHRQTVSYREHQELNKAVREWNNTWNAACYTSCPMHVLLISNYMDSDDRVHNTLRLHTHNFRLALLLWSLWKRKKHKDTYRLSYSNGKQKFETKSVLITIKSYHIFLFHLPNQCKKRISKQTSTKKKGSWK